MARMVSYPEFKRMGKGTHHVGTLCLPKTFRKNSTPSHHTHLKEKEKVISEKTLRPRASSVAGVRNIQANGFIYAITFGNCYTTQSTKLPEPFLTSIVSKCPRFSFP